MQQRLDKGKRRPGLAVVLVGEDPASQVYVRNKERGCERAGMASRLHRLAAETSEAELLQLVEQLNCDSAVHGILVQLPLPDQIDESKVLEAISPAKDADGFHPYNVGRLVTGNPLYQPCTPFGVMKMLEHTGVDLTGKDVVVVGRSNIVGKPIANMMVQKGPGANSTVTIVHTRTKDLAALTRQADIVVSALGIPNFLKADMVKEGVVVIDVGMNRVEEPETEKGYRLCGDVDFDSTVFVQGKAGIFTDTIFFTIVGDEEPVLRVVEGERPEGPGRRQLILGHTDDVIVHGVHLLPVRRCHLWIDGFFPGNADRYDDRYGQHRFEIRLEQREGHVAGGIDLGVDHAGTLGQHGIAVRRAAEHGPRDRVRLRALRKKRPTTG